MISTYPGQYLLPPARRSLKRHPWNIVEHKTGIELSRSAV
jgi:hypothetical protein